MDKCCHDFNAGKRLVVSCFRCVNCRLNSDPKLYSLPFCVVYLTRDHNEFYPTKGKIAASQLLLPETKKTLTKILANVQLSGFGLDIGVVNF